MNLLCNEPLSKHCTFGIGGSANYFVTVTTVEEAKAALRFAKEKNIPFFVLGKGSNCLFEDQGYDGLVILNKISHVTIDGRKVHVGSGYSFAYLGEKTAKKGLTGLEFASGIPATVGGAIYMNAGANKMETKDTLVEVLYLDENGQEHLLKKEDITFRYRFSSFHEKKGMIVQASFELKEEPTAKEKQREIITYRLQTQPYKAKTCGCVFQNPAPDIPAGRLIDACGLKGYSVGGAVISTMHANFVENQGGATAEDIKTILQDVQRIVKEKTGHELHLEVCVVSS